MIQKLLFLLALAFMVSSCQFTETMVLNEDGSGTMAVELNLNEMMSFGGDMMKDSIPVKIDTIINMKQFLEEKKDSIAKLSMEDQKELRKMENYSVHLNMNTETSEMSYDISTDFKSLSEVDNILNGLEKAGDFMPSNNSENMEEGEKEDTPDIIGVTYSFKNGIFKRDAYIKDEKLHQKEVDSLKSTEAFMATSKYTLKYTFPKPIKKSSITDASYSLDGKTITVQKSFIDYFKNPDVLDLEVELED